MKAKLITTLALLFPLSSFAMTEYYCKYTKQYSPETGPTKVDYPFFLEFTIFKPSDNIAWMKGNNGSKRVMIKRGPQSITFVETTNYGAVQVTAITKKMESAHSRNTIIDSYYMPSQFYGKCRKVDSKNP